MHRLWLEALPMFSRKGMVTKMSEMQRYSNVKKPSPCCTGPISQTIPTHRPHRRSLGAAVVRSCGPLLCIIIWRAVDYGLQWAVGCVSLVIAVPFPHPSPPLARGPFGRVTLVRVLCEREWGVGGSRSAANNNTAAVRYQRGEVFRWWITTPSTQQHHPTVIANKWQQ